MYISTLCTHCTPLRICVHKTQGVHATRPFLLLLCRVAAQLEAEHILSKLWRGRRKNTVFNRAQPPLNKITVFEMWRNLFEFGDLCRLCDMKMLILGPLDQMIEYLLASIKYDNEKVYGFYSMNSGIPAQFEMIAVVFSVNMLMLTCQKWQRRVEKIAMPGSQQTDKNYESFRKNCLAKTLHFSFFLQLVEIYRSIYGRLSLEVVQKFASCRVLVVF